MMQDDDLKKMINFNNLYSRLNKLFFSIKYIEFLIKI